MGYLIFFLIAMILIRLAPYLLWVFAILWLISTVSSIFMPRKRPFTQQNTGQPSSQQRPRPSGDVIDVEYTQRDADES